MVKKISVKLRITLWYTITMAVMSAIILTVMISASESVVRREITNRLINTVEENSMQFKGYITHGRLQPKFRGYDRGVHMLLFDSSSEIIGGNIPFGFSEELKFELKDRYLDEIDIDGNMYYMYSKEIASTNKDSIWLCGIISFTDEGYAVDSVIRTNLLLTVLLILIASVGGYIIVKKAFVPVEKISKTASEISESADLSRRIKIGEGNDEISTLANTFDDMLDKIENAFGREKQFTSDASHELRTPVAVILSQCEYMLECAKTKEEFTESAQSVKNQAEKMSKLISELLMISRMDNNTLMLNFEDVDISELLTFVCEEQREINSNPVTMCEEIQKNIFMKADRSLMARLFINIISNAYRFSNDGGTICVSLKEEDGKVIFSVSDEGIGISEENIPKIWERFYQVAECRTADENGSMGLGLSMVKWIAQCHGGEISVKSELGKGSRFIFVFSKSTDLTVVE